MKINKRLELIASLVPDDTTLIDVGCDHALLDIYLYQTKKNIDLTASDINPNPLKAASNNLKKYHLQDKIKILQNDGIKNISDKVETIVISGMGGKLIAKILEKKYLKNVKTIIVSPNNDFQLVRKKLIKNGYSINHEVLLTERRMTYLVIKANKGKKNINNYYFGKLNKQNKETEAYYQKILMTNLNILKQLPRRFYIRKIKILLENKRIIKFLDS